jgi:hypothetical protein
MAEDEPGSYLTPLCCAFIHLFNLFIGDTGA